MKCTLALAVLPSAVALNSTLSKTQLCGGASVVDTAESWVWSRDVGQSPSCTEPALESASQMCAGDPTSVVIQGSGQPQCVAASLHHCKFNMRDFMQMDLDVSMLDCGGIWAAPVWMTPDYWEGGGSAGEVDVLENCPSSALYSNFAGGGVPRRWTIANPNSFHGHTTMWKQADEDGVMSIHVKTCTAKEARNAGGSCPEEGAAYYRDIYGQNGCKDGNCMYTLISDLWNGWAGDGGFSECTSGYPTWGTQCRFSVGNIRMKGVPFMGKCRALLGWPAPAGALVSISLKSASLCVDLQENIEAKGTPVQVWGCEPEQPDEAQIWLFRDGQIIHRSQSGVEYCLDIPGNDRSNGKQLHLWTCKSNPQQQFMYQDGAIKTPDGAKCVDLRGEDMQTLQLWDCIPGAAAQQWNVVQLAPPVTPVVVSAYANSACLTLSLLADGAKVHTSHCKRTGEGAQHWVFQEGALRLGTDGLCLDIPENDRSNGKRLQVWSCNGSPQQRFHYRAGMVMTEDEQKCVDLRAEDTRAVQLWDCDMYQANQQWIVTPVPELSTPISV